MKSTPEPDPRRAPHPSAAAAIPPARPVTPPRRPYPTAPDLTPPSPWPGPDYLGTGASRAARPIIPSTVWLTPHPHLDDRDGRDRPAGGERDHELWPTAVLAAILDAFSTAGTAVALLPWPARSPAPSPANPTAPDHTTGRLRSTASRDHGIAAALETIAAAGGRPILLPDLDPATTNRPGTNTPDPTLPDTAPPDTTPPDTTPPDTTPPDTTPPDTTPPDDAVRVVHARTSCDDDQDGDVQARENFLGDAPGRGKGERVAVHPGRDHPGDRDVAHRCAVRGPAREALAQAGREQADPGGDRAPDRGDGERRTQAPGRATSASGSSADTGWPR